MAEKLTQSEQETHILIGRTDSQWEVTTSIPKDIRRLMKMGWEIKHRTYDSDGELIEVTFTAPRKAITFRNANPTKRTISEEHKARLLAAAEEARMKRKEHV